MKITIVNTQVPFIRGGAEYLAEGLAAKLSAIGHQVEIVCLPFKCYPETTLLQNTLAYRLVRVDGGDPDLVIALKFPAYFVPVAKKKIWLLHQFRQVYDLWGTEHQSLPNTLEGEAVRRMVIQADNVHLREASSIYTISRTVADRLQTYNGITADGVLYPPLPDDSHLRPGDPGAYFFYPGRLNVTKRQHLAVEAMRHVRSNFQLVLAGRPENDAYLQVIHSLIKKYRLQDRVRLLGWISDEEKGQWISGATGILSLPYDEDYGYVTLEAFQAHKPVITFQDAGGTTELMIHEGNGLVLEPNAEALAEGMERLFADRPSAVSMGHEGFETIRRHGIAWPHILERLVA